MDKKEPKNTLLTDLQMTMVGVVSILVIAVLLLNWFILYDRADSIRGTFGDMFGAANAFFTGLALIGVFYTVIMQINAMRIQKEELTNSKEELLNSKRELEISKAESLDRNRILEKQRFEITFFNMLNLQNEIVKNLQLGQDHGRLVIDIAKTQLFAILGLENWKKTCPEKGIPNQNQCIRSIAGSVSNARGLLYNIYFDAYYNRFSSNFNHYFRHLYHIFKFIYFSDLELSEKKFYSTLVRAQLSQGELFIIAFNIIIDDYGKPKFLYLVHEFDVLQNFVWSDACYL